MALNLSRGSVLGKEHSLCCCWGNSVMCSNGYVRDQCKDKSLDCVCESWVSKNLDSSKKGRNCWEGELGGGGGYCEPPYADDIVDLLPVDPFGMDMRSTFTAISGWIEDFEKGSGSYEPGESGGLFAGLNWVWNSAVMFQPEQLDGEFKFDGVSFSCDGFGIENEGFVLDDNVDEFLSFSHVVNVDVSYGAKEIPVGAGERPECSNNDIGGETGAPHDAMFYALSYLGVQDLLSVERVCKSLNQAVRSDPLLWRSINIDWPLNERITDDALINLTSRALGNVQTLSLVHCAWITDVGLQRVFESNPRLTKLSIPGCIKISVEGILSNLRALKSAGKPGIKQLRIDGLSGITDKQFEELNFLLGADNHIQSRSQKPRYFHGGLSYFSRDDDCAIDIEACPRCQRLSLVYDCPTESCQGKHQKAQMCRACILCITRCISCGCCLGDCDYVETFCLQLLCLECLENLLNCQERHDEKGASTCAIFRQESRYQFCLFG